MVSPPHHADCAPSRPEPPEPAKEPTGFGASAVAVHPDHGQFKVRRLLLQCERRGPRRTMGREHAGVEIRAGQQDAAVRPA